MQYKFFPNDNYEDFAGGRVIVHKSGLPGYPVRIAGEVFLRCADYLELESAKGITLYDPCCGGGYMLTVLGLLFPVIEKIYASDVDKEAVELAVSNLSLLTYEGLALRKERLEYIGGLHGKASHEEALTSVERFVGWLAKRKQPVFTEVFAADMLDADGLMNKNFVADIVMTDLPYGQMVSWSEGKENAADILLDTLKPVLHGSSVVAVSMDKKQKISNEKYKRLEKFQIGKRKIELLRLKH